MTPKYKFGYARVSTLEQDEALQHDALTAAGCERIFADKASGKLEHRPALDALLDQLRPGDTVVVWRLDRLGRSLRHLLEVVSELERRGVAFQSLTEVIDTSTPGGKLVFHLFGALAEFERELIRERTMAGLAAARAAGGSADARRCGPRTSCGRPGRCATAATTTSPPSPRSSGSAGPASTGPSDSPSWSAAAASRSRRELQRLLRRPSGARRRVGRLPRLPRMPHRGHRDVVCVDTENAGPQT